MSAQEKRARMLGEEKISVVLRKLAIPAIVAMLISAIYNMIDTMFVGMLGDTAAQAAVSIVFPIFILIAAIGQMLGTGAASVISRYMGENKKNEAEEVAATTLVIGWTMAAVFTVVFLLFSNPIYRAFGASETILPYANQYGNIVVLGAIITISNMMFNNIIRAEGNAQYSMIAISLGAVLNIILDPIFIFTLDMGVAGASMATLVAQAVSTVFLAGYYITKKGYLNINMKKINLKKSVYVPVFTIGAAGFARESIQSLSLVLFNIAAAPFGDAAVAAVGIVLRILFFAVFIVFGIAQAFQPIAGFNYGAKKFDRLFEAIKLSMITAASAALACSVLFVVNAQGIIKVFTQDPEVVAIGAELMVGMSVLLVAVAVQTIASILFQATGKGGPALLLAITRQGLFFIPLVVILPRVFGFTGLIVTQAIADALTLITSTFILNRSLKVLKAEAKESEAMNIEQEVLV